MDNVISIFHLFYLHQTERWYNCPHLQQFLHSKLCPEKAFVGLGFVYGHVTVNENWSLISF